MRIAFFTHQFPGIRMGGLGSYTVAAARALAQAGHDVHIFTFPVPPEIQNQFAETCGQAKVQLHVVPDLATRISAGATSAERASTVQCGGEAVYRLAMGALLEEALLSEHAKHPFDIVEAPEYEALALPLMLSLRSNAIEQPPAVVTQLHSGSAVGRYGNNLPETPADLAIDALEAAAILLADGVVAMTHAVVRETRRALGVERNVEIIPLAVPSEKLYVPPPADGPVLFVGRLERLKGVDVLLQAARIFLTRCSNARVRFVGPDTPTAPLNAASRSMRAWMAQQIPPELRDRIEFTSELSPGEVTAQMRGARFLALPSVVENFSLVAAQALGMGRTAIFSSEIGTAEIFGDAGLPFPQGNAHALADALASLWNDPAKIGSLSCAAFQRARNDFSSAAIVARQESFYKQVNHSASRERRDVVGIPPRLAGALIQPLVSMTRLAAGVRTTGQDSTPGQRLLAIMNQIAWETHQPHIRILLYGAGRHSARLLSEQHAWTAAGHEVVGFVDDGDRWKTEKIHLGLPVHSRQSLMQQLDDQQQVPPIVLSTDTFEDQFWLQTQQLRNRGVRVYRLYDQ